MVNDVVEDDKDFRKSQMDRVVDGVDKLGSGMESVGKFLDETKTANKISLYVSLGVFGILLISIIGGVILIGSNNIRDVFVNPMLDRNIECFYDDKIITIKSFEELKYFKETINGTCEYEEGS